MFTLTRVLCAVLMAVLAVPLAQGYQALIDPDLPAGPVTGVLVPAMAITGWTFLGGGVGRKLWFSAWLGVQAVALAAVIASLIAGVGRVFSLGYRRRYSEVSEAIVDIPGQALALLAQALDRDFLILAVGGAVLVGGLAHLADRLMTRRRLTR